MSLIDVLASAVANKNAPPPELSPELRALAIEQGGAGLIAHQAHPTAGAADRIWCEEVLKRSWAAHEHSLWNLKLVLGRLDEAGVEALSLKGPLLAQRLYSPPYLRKPSIDIDIAVREPDIERACEALTKDEYRPVLSPNEARRVSHHVVLEHPERKTVEMHFRLSHGVAGIPVADFFPRAIPFAMPCGQRTLILAPADELLHLVLHLVQDRFALLSHFAELRRAWQASASEVREQAIERAIAWRFTGALLLADAAFRYRWSEPLIPDNISPPRTWLSWRLNQRHYARWEAWMLGPEHNRPERNRWLQRIRGRWFDLQSTESPADAVRMIRGAIRAGVR